MYTGKAALRSVKNLKYSDVQNKVRSATSNDPWGPSGTDMSEIARMTFDPHSFVEIMDMLDRRMNDKGKNWRHVFKALTVLDYCLHSGSENTVKWAKDNIYIIKTLREFNYISEDGKDQGSNVRLKAIDITNLLQDNERLRSERKNRTSMHGRTRFQYNNNNSSSANNSSKMSSYNKSSKTSEALDEDKQLQYAIEESKLQSEDDKRKSLLKAKQEEEELALALQLSKEEEELRQMTLLQRKKEDSLREHACQQPQQISSFNEQFFNPLQQSMQSIDYMQNSYPHSVDGFQPQQSFGAQNIGYYPSQENYPQLNYSQINYPQYCQTTQTNNSYSSLIDTLPSSQNFQLNNSYANHPEDKFRSLKIGSNNPFAQITDSNDYRNNFNTISSPLNIYCAQKTGSSQTIPSAQSIFSSQQKPGLSYQEKLSSLLRFGNPDVDTFGNVGNLRIPSQHTGSEFVNSCGVRIKTEPTGVNTSFNQKINQQTLYHRQPILPAPTGVGFENLPTEQNHINFPPSVQSVQSNVPGNNPYDSFLKNNIQSLQNTQASGSLIDF